MSEYDDFDEDRYDEPEPLRLAHDALLAASAATTRAEQLAAGESIGDLVRCVSALTCATQLFARATERVVARLEEAAS